MDQVTQLDHRIRSGLSAAPIAFVAVAMASCRGATRCVREADLTLRSHLLIEKLQGLRLALADAEPSQRSFLVTGRAEFFEEYRKALPEIDHDQTALDNLTRRDPMQHGRLQSAREVIEDRLQVLNQTIQLRQDQGTQAATRLVLAGTGRRLIAEAMRTLSEMEQEQRELLDLRFGAQKSVSKATMALTLYGGPLTFLLLMLAGYFIRGGLIKLNSLNLVDQHHTMLLQSILEGVNEGVVVIDKQARLLQFNPAARGILGSGPTQSDPLECWPARYGLFELDRTTALPGEELPLVRALRGESTTEREIFIRNPDRPPGYISVSAAPLREQDRAISGGIAIFRDITERKLNEQKLGRINQALRRVSAAARRTAV